MSQHPDASMWVTVDGHARQERHPNARCDEARGCRGNTWQHQSVAEAASTQGLMFGLEHPDLDDEGKISWPDCLATLLQVGSAVGFCWAVNLAAA